MTHQQHNALFLQDLEPEFPGISRIPIQLPEASGEAFKKLVNLIKYSIPVHTFQQDILRLYEQVSQAYHTYIFRHSLQPQPQPQPVQKNDASFPAPSLPLKKTPQRCRMNYLQLARFVNSYTPEMEQLVSQEVVRQGQRFAEWEVKEVVVAGGKETPRKGQWQQRERQQVKLREKAPKSETVSITIGKNISRETYEMKSLLIKRAQSNRLLEEQVLTDLQRVAVEITFILNRLTEEYFQEFLTDLRAYACHELYSLVLAEKMVEKVLEEHNYTKLYSKLVRELRRERVRGEERTVRFQEVFVQQLQGYFYKFIRKGEWADKQQLYKKQLLGLSYFLGQLIHNRTLSKMVFPDIFYELVGAYIQQYKQYQHNKAFYYHEIYIECAIKVIEAMGSKYDRMLAKKSPISPSTICDILLSSDFSEDNEYSMVSDFIEILREVNRRLPSQRCKIAFLLEDFRCSKVMKNVEEGEENNEYEIVKDVLAIDHSNAHDVANIAAMIGKCDPLVVMKDFYFQFAEGNAKRVGKNIETFKLFMHLPGIYPAALQVLQENLEGLSLIECDFPFLAEGLARVMKQVCDHHRWEWKELGLWSEDEDVMEFVERVEEKYFKMIMQD